MADPKYVDHLQTNVCEVDIKKIPEAVESMLSHTIKTMMGSSETTSSNAGEDEVERLKKQFESPECLYTEEMKQTLLRNAELARQETTSNVLRKKGFYYLNFGKGNLINSTAKVKNFAMYAGIGVEKKQRETLGMDKWTLFPLLDNEKKPFYYMVSCEGVPHFTKKVRDSSGWECKSNHYLVRKQGGPKGTPDKFVKQIHAGHRGALTNFCSICPTNKDNMNEEVSKAKREKKEPICTSERIFIGYVIGQAESVDTVATNKTKFKPMMVGPVIIEMRSFIIGDFYCEGSDASKGRINKLFKYRFFQAQPAGATYKSNRCTNLTDEDIKLYDMGSMTHTNATLVGQYGTGYFKDLASKSEDYFDSRQNNLSLLTIRMRKLKKKMKGK